MYSLFNKSFFKNKFNELFNFIILDIVIFAIIAFMLLVGSSLNLWYLSSNASPFDNRFYLYYSMFSSLIIPIIIYIIISVFLLFNFNKRNEYLFLSHQPTTKDSITFTKLVLILFILIINLAILFFAIILFRIKYKAFLDLFNISILIPCLKMLFLVLAISLILINLLLILNYFINNGIIAILVSIFLVTYVPLFLNASKSIAKYTNLNLFYILLNIDRSINTFFYGYNLNYLTLNYFIQGNMLIPLVISILGLCGLILCSKILYKNIKIENFTGPFYNKGFVVFLNILVSLLIPLIVLSFLNFKYNNYIFILWLGLCILCVTLLNKFSKKFLLN